MKKNVYNSPISKKLIELLFQLCVQRKEDRVGLQLVEIVLFVMSLNLIKVKFQELL